MSTYSNTISRLRIRHEDLVKNRQKLLEKQRLLRELEEQHVIYLEAQSLLSVLADKNTTEVLDFITGVINKALADIFVHSPKRIYLERTLFGGKNMHINVVLEEGNGVARDIMLQTGTGVRQIVSFLYILCLIEVRKGRRLILIDELLSGLHPTAKEIIVDIISIFASEGFQFIMVEYGINKLGRMYLAEKPGKVSRITPLDGEYNNEVFLFNPPAPEMDLQEAPSEDEAVG